MIADVINVATEEFFGDERSDGGAGGKRGQLPLQLEDQQLRRNLEDRYLNFRSRV